MNSTYMYRYFEKKNQLIKFKTKFVWFKYKWDLVSDWLNISVWGLFSNFYRIKFSLLHLYFSRENFNKLNVIMWIIWLAR